MRFKTLQSSRALSLAFLFALLMYVAEHHVSLDWQGSELGPAKCTPHSLLKHWLGANQQGAPFHLEMNKLVLFCLLTLGFEIHKRWHAQMDNWWVVSACVLFFILAAVTLIEKLLCIFLDDNAMVAGRISYPRAKSRTREREFSVLWEPPSLQSCLD